MKAIRMRIILNILFITAFIQLFAQDPDKGNLAECIINNSEEVCLHINKQIYVTGEVLYYKTYLQPISKENEHLVSGQVYYEIINSENRIVHKWRCNVENETAMGQTQLPDTLSGGFYTIIAFTNIQRNFSPEILCHKTIIVTSINSENFKTVTKEITRSHSKVNTFQNINGGLQLSLSDKEIKAGDETRILLSTTQDSKEDSIEFSISVNEISPFDSIIRLLDEDAESHISSINKIESDDGSVFLKEDTYYSLSGKVLRKSDHIPLKNIFIVASATDSLLNYKYSRTDLEGRFHFSFDDYYDGKIITLQVSHTNMGPGDIIWQIDSKNSGFSVPFLTQQGHISDAKSQYLDKVRRAELVKRVYDEQNISDKLSDTVLPPYFPDPGYTVFPADYEALDNFKEIVDNLLPGVRFTRIAGKYKLAIVDNITQQIYDVNPMIFLNGQVFQNLEYLQTLSSEDIEKIDVYNTRFLYGNFNINGIVSIYTKNGGVEPSSYHNPYYLVQNESGRIQGKTFLENNSNIPNISPHISWIPKENLNKDKQAVLSFTAPVIKGEYCVLVKGKTNEGKFFKLYETFTVK